jgi:acetoin utilization deacetylase AcuC-like enzyme
MRQHSLIVIRQTNCSLSAPFILDRSGNSSKGLDTEERLQCIADGLRQLHRVCFRTPELSFGQLDPILSAVHSEDYLRFLDKHSAEADDKKILVDHPFIAPGVAPDTPLTAGMYTVARDAARTAAEAAMQIIQNASLAYALCRPPGHHAGRTWLGGYCYLNNAVIAVRTLLNAGINPVGLIDLDFHFGNGSAALLSDEQQVIFASVHCSTEDSYPYLKTEPAHERQLFISLGTSITEEEYLGAVTTAIKAVSRFGCSALVVSIGYDIIDGDPHGKWNMPCTIYKEVGKRLAEASIPICLVQEGGYLLERLGTCAFYLGMGLLGQTGV